MESGNDSPMSTAKNKFNDTGQNTLAKIKFPFCVFRIISGDKIAFL